MTKIYIGAGPAFYGAFDHLFLVKAPNDDLTTATETHKLIEAVPNGDVFGDPPFGNLIVFNDGDYNDSGNRLDQNNDGDTNDVGDLQAADKGLIEVSLLGDADWNKMVSYVDSLRVNSDPFAPVDTGYQYYGLTNPNSNSVIVSVLSVIGYDVYGNLPSNTSLSALSIPGYQYLLDGDGNTGSGTGYEGLQGFNYDIDNIILKKGGSDSFYGGDKANNVRFDMADGFDEVRYNENVTGDLIVDDAKRTFSGDDGNGFTDNLYSIEKVTLDAFDVSNTLDYSNFSSGIEILSGTSATETTVLVNEGDGYLQAYNFGTFKTTDHDDQITLRGADISQAVTVEAVNDNNVQILREAA